MWHILMYIRQRYRQDILYMYISICFCGNWKIEAIFNSSWQEGPIHMAWHPSQAGASLNTWIGAQTHLMTVNPVGTKALLLKTMKLFWVACNKISQRYFVSTFDFILEVIEGKNKIHIKNLCLCLHTTFITWYLFFAQLLNIYFDDAIFKTLPHTWPCCVSEPPDDGVLCCAATDEFLDRFFCFTTSFVGAKNNCWFCQVVSLSPVKDLSALSCGI